MLLQRWQSRRRGCVRPAALPCPPYAPLSWAAIVGRRTGGEEMLVMRPLRLSSPPLLLRWKGTPSPTQKQWITRNGFYAAKFWHPQKRKPRRPYIEALSAVALLHSPGGRGGRPHHMQATTPPPDADSVSYSGKICGSPRFALFTASQSRKSGNTARCLGKKQRPQRPARAKYSTVLLSNRTQERNKPSRPPERRPRFDPKSICPRSRN